MVFLHSDWWRPWNSLVSASDASLGGYGVSTSFWDPLEVADCGRRLERTRFRKAASTKAREHALTSAGVIRDELTEGWRRKEVEDEELLDASGWEVVDDFVEVPSKHLAKPLWEPKLWGKWDFEAGILELEGRALVKSLRRVALSIFGSDIRQLLLVDNLAVALSFDRFRSRSYPLLKQIRRFASYLLARNISTTVRWIPIRNSTIPMSPLGFSVRRVASSWLIRFLMSGARREPNLKPPLVRKRSTTSKASSLVPPKSEPKAKARKNVLEKRTQREDLFTPQPRVPVKFDLMDVDLWSPPRSQSVKRPRSPSVSSTSDVTSEGGQGSRGLKKRKTRRSRRMVDAVMENSDLSLLEKNAVGPRTHKMYEGELNEFKGRLRLGRCYHRRQAESGIPQQALLGWFPGQSGRSADCCLAPFPAEVWKTWSGESSPHMAGFEGVSQTYPQARAAWPIPWWFGQLWQCNYDRWEDSGWRCSSSCPSAAMQGHRSSSDFKSTVLFDHLKGSPGHGPFWWARKRDPIGQRQGEFDNSVSLDSPWLIPWVHTLFEYLKQNHPSSQLWDFDYNQLSTEFKKAATALGLELTPYQARHSGPSIDSGPQLPVPVGGFRKEDSGSPRAAYRGTKSQQGWRQQPRVCLRHSKATADFARKTLGLSCWGTKQVPCSQKAHSWPVCHGPFCWQRWSVFSLWEVRIYLKTVGYYPRSFARSHRPKGCTEVAERYP